MAGPSTLMAQAMVNHLMRGSAGAYTLTGPWKMKLWTANPDFDTGAGGTQLTGTGYTAGGQAVTMALASWNAAADGSPNGKMVSNIAVPTWTATAGDWSGPITGGSFIDSGGTNLMWGKALDNARTVGNGDTFRFSAAALKLALDQATEAGVSDFWKAKILDHFCCTDRAYSAPATAYMALWTTAPNFITGAGGTECAAGDYDRKSITMNTAWDAADANGVVDNTAEIAFTAATSSWGDIVAATLVSSVSGAFDMF
ncbi:MAG: hypothetical protein MUQ56_03680, partial [Thermoleophilia bacterium]|nr:hypothetical protein [Thermoleophilia bacterium]